MGYDHRIGFIKPGYDADIVLWDSHPLALGATPKQVFIDGIAQLKDPHVSKKPSDSQRAPKTPDYTKEIEETLKYDGLPPLEPKDSTSSIVVFINVQDVLIRDDSIVQEAFSASQTGSTGVVIVQHGSITCLGTSAECPSSMWTEDARIIDLEGGSISPSLISFGSRLGLHEIDGESSTNDGKVHDQLESDPPSILGKGSIIRAVDGLQFSTRDALLSYRSGVTVGVTAPESSDFLAGLSTAFRTGASHRLSDGAIVQDIAALHVSVDSSTPSVSTHIAALRNLLQNGGDGELGTFFKSVVNGTLPLVVQVQSADIMATLINLNKEIDSESGNSIQLTFTGANEAHLLAKEIGEAGIGVILNPSRPFPKTWKSKRILAGPPISQDTAISTLFTHNVTVGIGVPEQWASRNLRFDIAWAALEVSGVLSRSDAIALASVNLEHLLGVRTPVVDLVAVQKGTLLDFEGKVVGVISPHRGVVDLLV